MPNIRDAAYREWFYSRWGRESSIILASTREAEYPLFRQCLSIKAAWDGREDYFVDGRRVSVDDGNYLVLNEGREYSSRLRARAPVVSFSIFFRPGMAAEAAREAGASHEALLDDPLRLSCRNVEFSEHVRAHDRCVTPILKFIRHHIEAGLDDEGWYEEQLYFLLRRLFALRGEDLRVAARIPAARAATRKELFRRVGLGVDFINAHYAEPIGMAEISAAAMLSPFHCLRVFRCVHGMTPTAYLRNKRIQIAERLLKNASISVETVAALAGFRSRATLFRQVQSATGRGPGALRRETVESGLS